jgi:hypothetical protein
MTKVVAATVAVLAVAFLPSSAQAAPITECGGAGSLYGGGIRITNVTTRGVKCPTARRFSRSFVTRGGPACNEDRYCRFRGWDCLQYARGGKIDTRCTTGSRVIRWQWN